MRFRPACDHLRKCLPERRDGRSPAPWASSRLAWVDDRHLVIQCDCEDRANENLVVPDRRGSHTPLVKPEDPVANGCRDDLFHSHPTEVRKDVLAQGVGVALPRGRLYHVVRQPHVLGIPLKVCRPLRGSPRRPRPTLPRTWSFAQVQTCPAPDPQHLPLRVEGGLGEAREGPAAGLHGGQRRPGRVAFRGVRRDLGRQVPGDHHAVAQRVGGVHPVPRLRRGDPPGDLLDERDREPQRSLPPGGAGARALPDRTSGGEVPLPPHPRSLDPTGRGTARWITRWKPALNAFAITFEGRPFQSNTH